MTFTVRNCTAGQMSSGVLVNNNVCGENEGNDLVSRTSSALENTAGSRVGLDKLWEH